MVMRGDLDLAARQLLGRMIPAVVAEFQLEGLPSERNSGELMSEANSENRLASHQAANVADRLGQGRGSRPGRATETRRRASGRARPPPWSAPGRPSPCSLLPAACAGCSA